MEQSWFICSIIGSAPRRAVRPELRGFVFLLQSSEGCVVVVRLTEDNLLGLRSGSYVQGNEGS